MKKNNGTASSSTASKRVVREAEGAAAGALAGAAVGAAAGPPGAIAGAIIGGIAGAMSGAALDSQDAADIADERRLDEATGVIGGTIGAPNLKHPPAKIGAYSSGSTGTGAASGSGGAAPAEGPMSDIDAED